MPTLLPARKVARRLQLTRTATVFCVTTLLLAACSTSDGSAARDRAPAAAAADGAFDIVITNGHIVDGTGNAWFAADLGIRGDRIARIAPVGMLAKATAATRIDAGGKVVSPGFIDIQGQSAIGFTVGDGRDASKVSQLKRREISRLEQDEIHFSSCLAVNGWCDEHRLNHKARLEAILEHQAVMPNDLALRQGQVGFQITLEIAHWANHFDGINSISNAICGSSRAYLTVV